MVKVLLFDKLRSVVPNLNSTHPKELVHTYLEGSQLLIITIHKTLKEVYKCLCKPVPGMWHQKDLRKDLRTVGVETVK